MAGFALSEESTNNFIVSNNLKDNELDINNGDGLSPEENDNQFSDNICEKSDPEGLCN